MSTFIPSPISKDVPSSSLKRLKKLSDQPEKKARKPRKKKVAVEEEQAYKQDDIIATTKSKKKVTVTNKKTKKVDENIIFHAEFQQGKLLKLLIDNLKECLINFVWHFSKEGLLIEELCVDNSAFVRVFLEKKEIFVEDTYVCVQEKSIGLDLKVFMAKLKSFPYIDNLCLELSKKNPDHLLLSSSLHNKSTTRFNVPQILLDRISQSITEQDYNYSITLSSHTFSESLTHIVNSCKNDIVSFYVSKNEFVLSVTDEIYGEGNISFYRPDDEELEPTKEVLESKMNSDDEENEDDDESLTFQMDIQDQNKTKGKHFKSTNSDYCLYDLTVKSNQNYQDIYKLKSLIDFSKISDLSKVFDSCNLVMISLSQNLPLGLKYQLGPKSSIDCYIAPKYMEEKQQKNKKKKGSTFKDDVRKSEMEDDAGEEEENTDDSKEDEGEEELDY